MNGFRKIRHEFDEDPFGTMTKVLIIAGSAALVANIFAGASSKRAYARQINNNLTRR